MVVQTIVGGGKVGFLINVNFKNKMFYNALDTGIRLRFDFLFVFEICITGKGYNQGCGESWRKYPTKVNPPPPSITQQPYYLCLQQFKTG